MMIEKKIIVDGIFPENANEEAKFRVTVDPEFNEQSTKKDYDICLSLVISGMSQALSALLSNYDVLREPTNIEADNHFYYFESEEALATYKARRALHKELSEVFNTVLRVNFADVEYISKCDEHLQKLVFNKSDKALDKYKKKLEGLVEQVKKELEENTDVQNTEKSNWFSVP